MFTSYSIYVNTGVSRSKIFGVGEYPSGTFRFKKIDGSFWNGETFRFADYKRKKKEDMFQELDLDIFCLLIVLRII